MIQEFKPHRLIRGGQLQTLAGYFLKPPAPVAADEYIYVTMPDGDKIELAVNHPSGPVKATLYLLHGLGGDADSTYKLRIAKKLLPQGFRIIRHNHRGNGLNVVDTKGAYHSGSALDVLACLSVLRARWPDARMGMIGFSLSGTIMLNLLGRHAKDVEELGIIRASMSVCSPLDLAASSRALSQLRNRHLDLHFARSAIAQLHQRKFLSDEQAKAYSQKTSLRKVDEYVTAPYAGFRDAAHYYESCSPKDILSQINIDTLILAAADDPIVPAISVMEAPLGRHVTLRMEASGGHMGFLSQTLTSHGDYRWLDSFVESWAKTKLFEA